MKVKEYFRNNKTGLLKAIKCDCCGNKFIAGNDSRGLPNGVGFKGDDGELINICRMCMMNKTLFNKFKEERGVNDGKDNNN